MNDNELSCTPPAVIVPGTTALTVQIGTGPANKTSNQSCSYDAVCPPGDNALLKYYTLADVVIGRRPYVSELQGSLLVSTDSSLTGTSIHVAACTPGPSGGSWAWALTPQNGSGTLWFPLGGLGTTLNVDMQINITLASGKVISILRRLLRAPPRPSALGRSRAGGGQGLGAEPGVGAAGTVAVDHATRRLLLNGHGFLGNGWFSSPYNNYTNVSRQLQKLAVQARLGVNQVMPYVLSHFNIADQLAFMDGCHAMGVKVRATCIVVS